MKRITGLLLMLFSLSLAARESGYATRNYFPKEYDGYNQMWDAAQDKSGLLFFACTSNIFIYDGQSWERVPVKSGGATRKLLLDTATNTIYVATVSDFGYLQRAFNGKWSYVSLLPKIPKAAATFTDIWEIHQQGENIFFQANERIFIFRHAALHGIIEAPNENDLFALAFSANGRVFVRQRNVGMNEIRNGKLQLLPGGEYFGTERVLDIIPWENQSNLVITGDHGFMIMNPSADPETGSCFSGLPVAPDDFLLGAGVLGGTWINDSLFGINSRSGIGIYNRSGRLAEVFDKKTGMSDESIASIFIDREKNLWAMHNNGLTRITLNSPSRYFTDKSGINGTIQACMHFNGLLYLATTQGIFSCPGTGSQFQPLDFPKLEVWDLFDYNGDLLAGTTLGLARVKNSEFLTERNVNRIVPSPVPGELITAEKGGIRYLKIQPFGKPSHSQFIEMNDDLIRIGPVGTVAGQPALREFWCASRFHELLHVTLDVVEGKADVQRYDRSHGWDDKADYLVRFGDTTYFFESDSAYRYIPGNDRPGGKCFAHAPDIFKRLFEGDISDVKQPFDFRLFLDAKRSIETVVFGVDKNGELMRSRVIANHFFSEGVQYARVDTAGIAWMMSNDMLARINPAIKTNKDVPFRTLIRRVVLGEDSAIFFGSDKLSFVKDTALPYRNNSISFRYHAPFFDYEEQLVFSYMLEGYDTAWSKWSKQTVKDYTNLPEGTYSFRVKATNTYAVESEVSSYTFTILPPWYRTKFAYGFYGIGFIASIFVSVRLGARRLRRQKEKLELIVTERTAEVVQQKRRIEVQNEELETAYKGMRDSIHYAQRIQDAILPVQSDIRQAFPESFVLFRPRDIVSGDFYWFIRQEKKTFVACVDCTGHGVPGAFMSMIGNTLLNEIVLEKKVEAADEILNLLHLRVRQALHQDAGGETRDGMDIALCVIDHAKKTMQYAGANRPLWLIRNGDLIDYRPDKLSIAGDQLEEDRRFTRHDIALATGDCIYLSTDGYVDQFGGERGKKFMAKRFQALLKEIHPYPMEEQHTRLDNAFNTWKGNLEQVDDVLVIGFRYLD